MRMRLSQANLNRLFKCFLLFSCIAAALHAHRVHKDKTAINLCLGLSVLWSLACADDVNGYLRMASMCATVGKHSRAIGKLRLGLERYPTYACLLS